MPSGLSFHITGLWYPGATSTDYYGQITDPFEGSDAFIPLDDSRTSNVTFSLDDDIVAAIPRGKTYARMLKVYDGPLLVFWGPIKLKTSDYDKGTMTLSAVDPSLRLIHHQLRRGDLLGVLNEANKDKGSVSVDHIGLRQLRDAGQNTAEQTARGVPDLGIGDGFNDYAEMPFNRMGVQRGDQVWNQMLQLSQSLGPDFELQPVDDAPGIYCHLNTFVFQGEDISSRVAWHYGTGLQNLLNLEETEGSKYTTHAHVLPRDHPETYRVTKANIEASGETGPYVDWDATDFDSEGITEAKVNEVLGSYAEDLLKAYSRPLESFKLTLPPESPTSFRYWDHYKVGDTVGVAARRGRAEIDAYCRIVSVRLKHGADGDIEPEVEVITDKVAELGDTFTGSED